MGASGLAANVISKFEAKAEFGPGSLRESQIMDAHPQNSEAAWATLSQSLRLARPGIDSLTGIRAYGSGDAASCGGFRHQTK